MTHQGKGLPDAMRAHFTRQHYLRHSLMLVVDNSAPVRRQRQPIRGIRIINGQDDGGPDAA